MEGLALMGLEREEDAIASMRLAAELDPGMVHPVRVRVRVYARWRL